MGIRIVSNIIITSERKSTNKILNRMPRETNCQPKAAPAIELVQSVEEIWVVSHVSALSYEAADARIREGADSLSFKISDSCLGRVDVVSLGTKIPSADRWDVCVLT